MRRSETAAVLDLGTNTFHLIIAEKSAVEYTVLHHEKQFVHLGKEGLGHLSDPAIQRAMKTLFDFHSKVKTYAPQKLKIVSTAALRRADNASFFLQKIKEELGWDVDIISGDEEARLIHLGVVHTLENLPDEFIIMDIGGGSTEFIHSKNKQILWKYSFDLGVTVLSPFHTKDPITTFEKKSLFGFLQERLQPLLEYIQNIKSPVALVGASGSFNTLRSMTNTTSRQISIENFEVLRKSLCHSTLQQRMQMKGLPNARAGYIVTACLLIDFVLDVLQSSCIFVSPAALKEGILWELFHSSKSN